MTELLEITGKVSEVYPNFGVKNKQGADSPGKIVLDGDRENKSFTGFTKDMLKDIQKEDTVKITYEVNGTFKNFNTVEKTQGQPLNTTQTKINTMTHETGNKSIEAQTCVKAVAECAEHIGLNSIQEIGNAGFYLFDCIQRMKKGDYTVLRELHDESEGTSDSEESTPKTPEE